MTSIYFYFQEDSVHCPNCQHPNADSAKFCTNCGYPLRRTEVSCTNCGCINPTTNGQCRQCGAQLIRPVVASQNQSPAHTPYRSAYAPEGQKKSYYVDLTDSSDDPSRQSRPQRERDDQAGFAPQRRQAPGMQRQQYYRPPVIDDDPEYDFEDYDAPRPRFHTGRLILTLALAIVALAVVLAIVHVIKNLMDQPPLPEGKQFSGYASSTSIPTRQSALPPSLASFSAPTFSEATQPPPTQITAAPTPSSVEASEKPATEMTLPPEVMLTIQASEGYVMRAEPKRGAQKLTVVPKGAQVQVLGVVEGETVKGYGNQWYIVKFQDVQGFMIKDPKGQH